VKASTETTSPNDVRPSEIDPIIKPILEEVESEWIEYREEY
jgi:hypothetical protein